MSLMGKNFLIRIGSLLLFILLNFIGFKAFSAINMPVCELTNEGYIQNHWKNIRIQADGVIVGGAETLSDLAKQLTRLALDQRCKPLPHSCPLATEGFANNGVWVKHRIVVNETTIFGANTTARVFDQLGQLQKMGICE